MSNTKGQSTIQYEPHELAAIEQIAEMGAKLNQQSFNIGKVADDLVERAGGLSYGDSVFRRISMHPAIGCSEQHLRRCWKYFRLYKTYGAQLEKLRLCESAKYELARFLDKDLGDDQEKHWVVACAKRATDTGMSVDQLARLVSNSLEQLDKLRKPKSPKTPAQNTPATPSEPNRAPWPYTGIEAFKAAAEVFDKLAPRDHHAHLNSGELRRSLVLVLRPLIDIADSISVGGTDSDIAVTLEAFGRKLIACAEQLRDASARAAGPPAEEPATVPATNDVGAAGATAPGAVAPTGRRRGRPRKLRVDQQTPNAAVPQAEREAA